MSNYFSLMYLRILVLIFLSIYLKTGFSDVNAVYYENTQLLVLNEVIVDGKIYHAELKNIGDGHFQLTDQFFAIENQLHDSIVNYHNTLLDIPVVFAFNQLFKAQLKYAGNKLFNLTSVVEINKNSGDLKNYVFSSLNSKVIEGMNTENVSSGWNCKGIDNQQDTLDRLTLVSIFYQNGCYTNGQYNDVNYLVKQGVVTDGQERFDAYQISPPAQKAAQFLASKHAIFYKFPSVENYTLYQLSGKDIIKLKEITSTDIQANQFIKIGNVFVNDLQSPSIYFFAPNRIRISQFTPLSLGMESAKIMSTAIGDLIKYRLTVKEKPFDSKVDFTAGPDSWDSVFGDNKHFFVFKSSANNIAVIWQNSSNFAIQLTQFSETAVSYNSIALPNEAQEILAAATTDPLGNIYYVTVQSGDGSKNNISRTLTLYKLDSVGKLQLKKSLDTGKNELNIIYFGQNNIASLAYLNGQLGLIIGRKMHSGADGLNHQGAIAVIFDANTLALLNNLGQTSGHSFGNLLTTHNGQFVGIDLGDNYPRGIHLHKFDGLSKQSKVVYTFKTEHGQQTSNPAGKTYPVYQEISNAEMTYYRWSNDNKTYTELGGLIPYTDGYSILFSGEKDTHGFALDNTKTTANLNEPRNIGLVKVIPDFELASGTGNIVSDDLMLTSGLTENGGFYTFNGAWEVQRNSGVVWLTDYQDKDLENASRVKSVRLPDHSILIIWEKWSANRYLNTYALRVDSMGNKLSTVVELGNHVRLDLGSELKIIDNQVYIVSGDSTEGKLEVSIIKYAN